MVIVWDERKRKANLVKHGIDFADISEHFMASAMIRPVRHGRYSALGVLNGVVTVIFARLGTEGISLISARPANRSERKLLA